MIKRNIKTALLASVIIAPFVYSAQGQSVYGDDGTQLIAQESLLASRNTLGQSAPLLDRSNGGNFSLLKNKSVVDANAPKKALIDDERYSDVDLAALYYYAKERQHERVEAEIKRLHVIHPGFIPPEDLYARAQKLVPNEQSLWDLFALNDFTGIDAEIIRRKTEDPKWGPTDDFSQKLMRKKLRIQMAELARTEDWIGVVSVGNGIDPATETDVNLVWTLIDAFSGLEEKAELSRFYRGLLFRDTVNRLSDEHLMVTLQKALRDFPAVEVRRIMTGLWPVPSAVPGIEKLKVDMVRKSIADFNMSEVEASPVASMDVKRLTEMALESKDGSDLSLLGWYQLKVEKPVYAQPLFELAMQVDPNYENAKGYYLSLTRQNLDSQAFEFAKNHLEALSDDPIFLMNALSPKFDKPKPGVITEQVLLSYSNAILETNSAAHAEILGWYAYNSRQFKAAFAWFLKSFGWEESSDRLKGLALTHLRLGQKGEYASLKERYGNVYPNIWPEIVRAKAPVERKAVVVSRPKTNVKTSYVKAFERKDYRSCLAELDRLSSKGLSTGAWLIRGWCYLGMSRVSEAQDAFAHAMRGTGKNKSDAVYGRALSLLRVRLTDDAESLIMAHPLSSKRQNELLSEIYFQRARSAFDFKQYERTLVALNARAKIVTEPRDLTLMRGWAYHHLGYSNEASTIFRRMNMHLRDGNAAYGAHATSRARGG